jgi:hypothetical protein
MGYYTTYNLKVKTKNQSKLTEKEILTELKSNISPDREIELLKALRDKTPSSSEIIEEFINEFEDAAYALDKDGSCYELCKWYEHEEELRKFSKKHPEAIFKLKGEGEESGDIWIKYFKN